MMCAAVGFGAGTSPGAMAQQAETPEHSKADSKSVVFRSGTVYTGNPAQPWAEAVAVKGKVISAVGTNA
jgi:hypothetical protein